MLCSRRPQKSFSKYVSLLASISMHFFFRCYVRSNWRIWSHWSAFQEDGRSWSQGWNIGLREVLMQFSAMFFKTLKLLHGRPRRGERLRQWQQYVMHQFWHQDERAYGIPQKYRNRSDTQDVTKIFFSITTDNRRWFSKWKLFLPLSQQ
jgi:hypothetical protein